MDNDMSKSTATHEFRKAQAWALRQHGRVTAVLPKCKKQPLTKTTGMRSVLGLLDPDDGAVTDLIIVRYCDPGDADDHQMHWPTTISDRFRWNSAGLVLDSVRTPTHEQYDVIADAIVAEAERLRV